MSENLVVKRVAYLTLTFDVCRLSCFPTLYYTLDWARRYLLTGAAEDTTDVDSEDRGDQTSATNNSRYKCHWDACFSLSSIPLRSLQESVLFAIPFRPPTLLKLYFTFALTTTFIFFSKHLET